MKADQVVGIQRKAMDLAEEAFVLKNRAKTLFEQAYALQKEAADNEINPTIKAAYYNSSAWIALECNNHDGFLECANQALLLPLAEFRKQKLKEKAELVLKALELMYD